MCAGFGEDEAARFHIGGEDTDESLKEGMAKPSWIKIDTGLTGQHDKSILDSLLGQLSDGLWENSPRMAKYWKNFDVELDGDKVIIRTPENFYAIFDYNMGPEGEAQVKKFFATYLKKFVKQAIEWGWAKEWSRDCEDQLKGFHEPTTVKEVYRVYDKLLGRKDRVDANESKEDLAERKLDGSEGEYEKTKHQIKRQQEYIKNLESKVETLPQPSEDEWHNSNMDELYDKYQEYFNVLDDIEMTKQWIGELEGYLAEIRYIDNGNANDYSGFEDDDVDSDLEIEDRLQHLKDLYDMEPGDLTPDEIKELRDAGMLEESIEKEIFHRDNPLKSAVFMIDGLEEYDPFEGYDLGVAWNGWACPAFEKEEADRLAEINSELLGDEVELYFDEANDRFVEVIHEYDSDVTEERPDANKMFYEGADHMTEDGVKHLYPIGAWEWTWFDTTPAEDADTTFDDYLETDFPEETIDSEE